MITLLQEALVVLLEARRFSRRQLRALLGIVDAVIDRGLMRCSDETRAFYAAEAAAEGAAVEAARAGNVPAAESGAVHPASEGA